MTNWEPAEVFPPGDFLREELEERGWSQTDFAAILDRSVGMVNDLLAGKRTITPETAQRLSAALGSTPEYWLNLEAAYQLSKVGSDSKEAIGRRASIYTYAPVREMMKRGWIAASDDAAVLEARVLRFFGTSSVDEEPQPFRHAARKASSYDEPLTRAQLAWLARAAQIAKSMPIRGYSKSKLDQAIENLKPLLEHPEEIRHVPRILGEAGIRFIVLEGLPSNKIDGAVLWTDDNPTLVMSLRFDRIDNFWFVLFHELGHVREGHGHDSIDIDLTPSDQSSDRPDAEIAADRFAQDQLVPRSRLDNFVARVKPMYSLLQIEAFARTIHVHPGLVVGQLHYRCEIPYSSFRKAIAKVRSIITAVAVTDGWGSVLHIESWSQEVTE